MTRSRTLFVTLPLALALARPTTASAEETATDMRSALMKCKPSCYEPAKHEGRAKLVKVCAYLPIHFTQDKKGNGWGKLERSSAMSPIAVPNCKFPKTVPGKWKAVVAEAKKQLDLAKGDVVSVDPDVDDWGLEKDSFERVTARDVLVNHYSRNHEDYDRCNCGNPFAVCEGVDNEVTSFNQATYRLNEAKQLLQAGQKKECRIDVWDAVRQAADARKERARQLKDGDWKSKTYATRYDGVLSEKEMFAKLEAIETEGKAMWASCGGTGEIPFD